MGEKHSGSQGALWHETVLDALSADIYAAGGFKVVGPKVYPHLAPGTAANQLRNTVNGDQQHKLCPLQTHLVKKLARAAGSIATMTFEARELDCEIRMLAPAAAKKAARKARVAALLAELAQLSDTDD